MGGRKQGHVERVLVSGDDDKPRAKTVGRLRCLQQSTVIRSKVAIDVSTCIDCPSLKLVQNGRNGPRVLLEKRAVEQCQCPRSVISISGGHNTSTGRILCPELCALLRELHIQRIDFPAADIARCQDRSIGRQPGPPSGGTKQQRSGARCVEDRLNFMALDA